MTTLTLGVSVTAILLSALFLQKPSYISRVAESMPFRIKLRFDGGEARWSRSSNRLLSSA